MPGTIRCTADLCSATAGPGTHCGQGEEGKQSHKDRDLELYPVDAAGPGSKQL